jgi:hypothetical protein
VSIEGTAPDPDLIIVRDNLVMMRLPEQIEVREGELGDGEVHVPKAVMEKMLMVEGEGLGVHSSFYIMKRGSVGAWGKELYRSIGVKPGTWHLRRGSAECVQICT